MYAIIATGGKQYKVSEGDVIKVEKLGVEAGSAYTFDQVLVVGGEETKVGDPVVAGATVEASVVEDGKDKKVIVYKYKRKTGYHKKQGHRQPYTKYNGVQVIGHADSVEEGADLVCCSVSVLTINLVNSLDTFTDDEFEVTEQEELGLVQVTFKNPLSDKALLLMDSFDLGVHSIEEQYDIWLKVITREV